MSDQITDKRGGFTVIENAVIYEKSLTPFEGWLYVVIVSHVNQETGKAFPGITRLAKLAGMGRSSVIKALDELVAKELIIREHRPNPDNPKQKLSNQYTIPSVRNKLPGVSDGLPPGVSDGLKQDSVSNNTKEQISSADIHGMIGAYLAANRSMATTDYKNKTIRSEATALIKAGITSKQVFDYITDMKRQPFWQDKAVSLHNVLTNIATWLTKQPAATPTVKSSQPINLLAFTEYANQDGE